MDIIVEKCSIKDKEFLKEFLKEDIVFNTFILADIDIYGFDKAFQDVYMKKDYSGNCESVYLRFYNNLIVTGENLDLSFITSLLKEDIAVIMGKDKLIKQVNKLCKNNYNYSRKFMYSLDQKYKLLPHSMDIELAGTEDVDMIHSFLRSIEGFENMYKSKDMILNRIQSGEGDHLYIKKDGHIISHANSAAKSQFTTMIGGVATHKDFRGNNLAKEIVSFLSQKILSQDRIPCTFSDRAGSDSFLTDIGFEEIGRWGTLEKIKEDNYE